MQVGTNSAVHLPLHPRTSSSLLQIPALWLSLIAKQADCSTTNKDPTWVFKFMLGMELLLRCSKEYSPGFLATPAIEPAFPPLLREFPS